MSDKYTDPKVSLFALMSVPDRSLTLYFLQLRDEVKEEMKQGDKGGAPGQWSARKAQMMASEYKKRGGGYKTDKSEQDSRQKHLNEWTEEEWQTKDGSGSAKKDNGTQQRYLPKKAWEKMSEKEKKETDEKKQKEGKSEGKQFVGNTDKAKQSRKEAQEETHDGQEESNDGPRRSTRKRSAPSSEKESTAKESGGAKSKKQKTDSSASDNKSKAKSTKSNGTSKKSKDDSNKEDEEDGKTYGSKHDKASPPEGTKQASKDNLPSKGQQVHWKAMPG